MSQTMGETKRQTDVQCGRVQTGLELDTLPRRKLTRRLYTFS